MLKTRQTLLTLLFAFATLAANARTYFVAPAGDDKAEGTKDSPFRTFGHAQKMALAGDTVFFRQGKYRVCNEEIQNFDKAYASVFNITRSGRKDAPIVFSGYGDERAEFDMSQVNPGNYRLTGILLEADYIVFRQLEITGLKVLQKGHSQSECIRIKGANSCVVENCSFHDGMAIGIYLLDGRDNLFLNCDAYNNYDYLSDGGYGGNTDGFGAHCASEQSTGNVFRGCRAWWNSDDGFDLINCLAAVRIEDCVAFYNGFRPGTLTPAGDGTGFKAGGFGMKTKDKMVRVVRKAPRHAVINCIAFRNKNKGVYANHHLGGVDFIGNVSIANPKNFCMLCRKSVDEATDVPGYDHKVVGNISIAPRSKAGDYTDYNPSRCKLEGNTTLEKPDFAPEKYLSKRKADGTFELKILLKEDFGK
ncbi:MAG: right-handed parallel beta-helix repeat-containing protein [Bacteroidaceae bacterium]|nr:right-handed parallel beta-helix repeat-containing protein [Bacteroidaceae bacterium]